MVLAALVFAVLVLPWGFVLAALCSVGLWWWLESIAAKRDR
jgi:hypothetical protein